jgi:hypothetical protein
VLAARSRLTIGSRQPPAAGMELPPEELDVIVSGIEVTGAGAGHGAS